MVSRTRTASRKPAVTRRDVLSCTAALGGMTIIGAAAGPASTAAAVPAAGRTAHVRKSVSVGNATADDFAELVGESFGLRTEDGKSVRATLIEVNVPRTRRALRFRREHFSLVFDVPRSSDRAQGRYGVSHPTIGSLELFMVPVDLPARHSRLEAVFT